MGFVGRCNFRHMAQPRCPRMHRVGNPHKFADAFVITADSGQQIAHDKIAQALHGRQHEPAGTGFFGSVVHKTEHFGDGCLNGGILTRLPAMQKQPAHDKKLNAGCFRALLRQCAGCFDTAAAPALRHACLFNDQRCK